MQKEEERLRAAVRRENQQKRVRERNSQRGLTANYIEPDREVSVCVCECVCVCVCVSECVCVCVCVCV